MQVEIHSHLVPLLGMLGRVRLIAWASLGLQVGLMNSHEGPGEGGTEWAEPVLLLAAEAMVAVERAEGGRS